jgi:hypothetical protein
MPAVVMPTNAFSAVLQDHADTCTFAGLSWSDAKNIAAAVSLDGSKKLTTCRTRSCPTTRG